MAKKKKHHTEGHENGERWLLTYADLITLLLCFFIILYAMSDANPAKFDIFAKSLSIAFNNGQKDSINLNMSQIQSVIKDLPPTPAQQVKMMKAVAENNNLLEIKKKIDAKVAETPELANKVKTELTKEGLDIVLNDAIFFASGEADLKKDYIYIINSVSSLIVNVPNPVKISGFTDNIPISTPVFPTNWELSTARSVAVLKEMIKTNGMNPTRYSASGYGEYRPVTTNTTEEGRRANRRVEILIERIHTDGLLETKPNTGGGLS
jgi:chemotaxis protein MotB